VRYNDGGPVIGGVNGGNMGLYITPGCLHLPAGEGKDRTGRILRGRHEREEAGYSVGGRQGTGRQILGRILKEAGREQVGRY
jgi:hypothetical protein